MVKVSVTQEDISKGIRASNRSCPVARALQRIFGEETVVGLSAWWNSKIFGSLPKIASSFILDFDRDNPVFPFEFEIDDPR